jgi:hypothetical protein
MALKLNERYPGRFNSPTAQYPQGSFKNRTAPGAKDGSYLEQDWANDALAFLSSLLSGAGLTANGSVDTVGASQYYTALQSIIGSGTLLKANNLSDLPNKATARTNLELLGAALLGVASNAQMATGTSTTLLPTVAAVMSLFSKRSFATDDYIRFPDVPGGLIIQWCGGVTTTTGDSSQVVTFPIPFPTFLCHLSVTTIALSQSVSDAWFQQLATTLSNCTVVAQYQSGGNVSGGVNPRVIAIGY